VPETRVPRSRSIVITYDGAPTHSVSIMELDADDQVARETQFFADPFPPAPSRASLAE
jgi:hypothetical protein